LTEAFFDRVSFIGMGGIEFKRNSRTGQFLMIEPTVGRVDGQEEVATLHGLNIPLAAYLHALEARVAALEARLSASALMTPAHAAQHAQVAVKTILRAVRFFWVSITQSTLSVPADGWQSAQS
jgi:hypothetical protein